MRFEQLLDLRQSFVGRQSLELQRHRLGKCRTSSNDIDHCGSRQQFGLHGPVAGGGQSEARGSDEPLTLGAAGALMSRSTWHCPHTGQAGDSLPRISSSNSTSHPSQWYSNSGIARPFHVTRRDDWKSMMGVWLLYAHLFLPPG